MPEPGVSDLNFSRPKPVRKKVRPKSRVRMKLPGEYAEFRLMDGRYLGDVMGDSFFGPETGAQGDRPITDIERQRIRDGSLFKPRSEVESGRSKSREPLEEPAAELPTRSESEQTSDIPLPRPAEAESDIARMLPNRDRGYPDKWAEKGWGGPRGLYSVPTLNNGGERTANILADKPARFNIRANPEADPSDPWYASTLAGDAAISSYGPVIEKEARRQGVDPDLAKAIAYSENARGHYFGSAKAAEGLDMADSFLPMNINP